MILERLWRWRVTLMTLGVAAVAGFLRFGSLNWPKELVFDEVFYARGAYSLVTLGYEGDWGGDNQDFAHGDYSHLSTEGDYIVHPLTGKLLIGLGIELFGPTPFGWRFMSAVVGTLTCVMIAFIARHLLRSTLWGGVAGLFLAVEGEHLVLSRTALLDIFLAFFAVAGFGLLLVDRMRTRERLRVLATAQRADAGVGPDDPLPGGGARTGIRWWRFAAVVALALGVTVKWSGLYFLAAFMVLSVVWDMIDRRAEGWEKWFSGAFVRAIPAFFMTLITTLVVYVGSWLPWFRSENSYGRHWAEEHPGEGVQWLPESLRSLFHYHEQMYEFHRTLDSPHNYESNPWTWMFQWRPTAFYFEDVDPEACGADRCVSAIHAIGHPLLWWTAAAVLVYALWRVLARRDMTALAISVGLLAGWIPWLPFAHRTIFTFYTVVMAPFVVLLVVWALKRIAQPEELHGRWSRTGGIIAAVYVAAVLVIAAFFIPVWIGAPVSFEYWQLHMWLPSWV